MSHRFCVAPMMDRTDRHERYFLRTLSKEMLLYTEMIHANAVIHGNKDNLLNYHASEHPTLYISVTACTSGLPNKAISLQCEMC